MPPASIRNDPSKPCSILSKNTGWTLTPGGMTNIDNKLIPGNIGTDPTNANRSICIEHRVPRHDLIYSIMININRERLVAFLLCIQIFNRVPLSPFEGVQQSLFIFIEFIFIHRYLLTQQSRNQTFLSDMQYYITFIDRLCVSHCCVSQHDLTHNR
jgi:hypothetical protein